MRSSFLKATLRTAMLASASVLLTAGTSPAATVEVCLAARRVPKSLPGNPPAPSVATWVFTPFTDAAFPACAAASATAIEAEAGDSLTVHLRNELPTPVSVVIPGQASGGSPTWTTDAQGRQRVQSFGPETLPGATGVYTWSSLRPGTYLYQSGTHPSIQVAMGLYGALVVNGPGHTAASPVAYAGIGYQAAALVLFSEIDAVQNNAVDALAAAGPIDPAAYPSTIDYRPTYFLINGNAYDKTSPPPPLAAGLPGNNVLLRFLNAGLHSHTPAPVGLEMKLVAEDGNPYPGLPRRQNAALLAAGKTLDAVVTMPAGDASYPLYDRMLELTNDNKPEGGMLAYLKVGTGSGTTPPGGGTGAADDAYVNAPPNAYPWVVEDVTRNVGNATSTLRQGVLLNDNAALFNARVAVPPANGSLVLRTNGSFSYTPNPNFSGEDSFVYIASNGGVDSNPATVRLLVTFVNDRPLAATDAYTNGIATLSVPAPGVLGNDRDADGDTLTAQIVGTAPAGLTVNSNGSFTYTGAPGTVQFRYRANDGTGSANALSNPAIGTLATLTIRPASNIALLVKGPLGEDVPEYRWLVEEDASFHPNPNVANPPLVSLGTSFHKSHMPVLAQGCVGAICGEQTPFGQVALDPTKHYYVSVLPNDAGTGAGHTMGGASIPTSSAGSTVTVTVNKQPIPSAQMSIFVFEDNAPTNGAVDQGSELGLVGFQINLEDAGGRYGQVGGLMLQDVFGQPLRNALPCAPTALPGVIVTCSDGTALVQNLPPGKYGVSAIPPAGAPIRWVQTTTIEGKKVNDAWVKAGEPPFFQEFGPPGYHIFVGFVSPDRLTMPAVPVGTAAYTVSGKVTNLHMSRPPNLDLWDSGSYAALGHTNAWVGLNSAAGAGANVVAVQADDDGNFTIPGVPEGNYQLVVWDDYLDQIIAYRSVILSPTQGGELGNVPVFQWFARLEHNVFLDTNENGVRDAGEAGLSDQNVNLRLRDGTIYQSFPTDTVGFVPFDEVFPFFHWLVAEVDFARYKPTGVTVTVDGGGDTSTTGGVLRPQVQAGGGTSRTDPGPVLIEAFQGFLGQTSTFDWGKAPYQAGENGGISGIVYYTSTRAENDPRLAAADPWEPGIPRVKVRLYREVATASGGKALSLVQEVQTDSWDLTPPTDCPGADPTDPTYALNPTRCYDGLRNFNQVRPGVFDGGYAFTDIPPGKYVVEVVPPSGFELVKEEDNNVGFGDVFATAPVAVVLPNLAQVVVMPDLATVKAAMAAEPGLAQPVCVGAEREVPPYLSLFPDVLEPAPFAAAMRPLCDRKQVILSDQGQAAADFFLFTSTPIAGHFVGMVLDDLAQEFNKSSINFGEKWAPPFVPVSVRDYTGREISRLYSDKWGRFNGLLPSTFSANIPMPSGFSPAMLTTCMNDPGPIPDPANPSQMITDPHYDPMYSNFCYNFQYMPGTTTYLDTPVLPTAAFAAGDNPVDCAFPANTPAIRQVDGSGPGPFVNPAGTLTIQSMGTVRVPNPNYNGPGGGTAKTIVRNYGFGVQGVLSSVTVGGIPLVINTWSPDTITATLPAAATTGELIVTRSNGLSTVNSVTVTVSNETPLRVPGSHPTIQAAIDAAAPGALILVGPGTYDELAIMWKPVRLQGAGAGSTFINAVKRPTEKLIAWRQQIDGLVTGGSVDLLPGQQQGGANALEPDTLGTEEGAGITVLAKNDGSFQTIPSRIDGFTITGGDTGGGIFVNGWAHRLEISNNRVVGNSGYYHGGIRVGRPFEDPTGNGPFGFNNDVTIHHNAITTNGGLAGAGGGLSLCTGTDGYRVDGNFICGNFSAGDGGGIGHLGLSHNGRILNNRIVFNQSFNQGQSPNGGGVFIGGEAPAANGVTLGAGSVSLDANLIQGNQAAAGHGGGVRTQFVNGMDVLLNPATPGSWYQVRLTNNMILNNVAGWTGGGLSLQDTARGSVINNTIANNDSTATVGNAFTVGPDTSAKQPAGISTESHSPGLVLAFGGLPGFSNPTLTNNIVWHNRAFHYETVAGVAQLLPALAPPSPGSCAGGTAYYWDLGALGDIDPSTPNPSATLNPTYSVLTSTTGYGATNISSDPLFASQYCNGARSLRLIPEVTTLQVAPALDEGGNFIDVRYGPLTLTGNYHIGALSPARSNATLAGAPNTDFDRQGRPQGAGLDRGADERP